MLKSTEKRHQKSILADQVITSVSFGKYVCHIIGFPWFLFGEATNQILINLKATHTDEMIMQNLKKTFS